jgi:hypothetical protein
VTTGDDDAHSREGTDGLAPVVAVAAAAVQPAGLVGLQRRSALGDEQVVEVAGAKTLGLLVSLCNGDCVKGRRPALGSGRTP